MSSGSESVKKVAQSRNRENIRAGNLDAHQSATGSPRTPFRGDPVGAPQKGQLLFRLDQPLVGVARENREDQQARVRHVRVAQILIRFRLLNLLLMRRVVP
jgi:hypothetical protein